MSEPRIIRDDALYISWQLRKALNYVPKTEDEYTTSDAIAEKVLRDWLHEKHPDILQHIKAQIVADDEFKKSIERKPPF